MDSIIFDVDGTLWDSTDIVAEAWNEVICKNSDRKPNITGDTLKSLFGRTLPEIAKVIFCGYPQDQQIKLIELCCAREHEVVRKTGAPLYAHLEETLQYLSAKYPLYIVSNCQSGYIEIFLEFTGFGRYFQGHLCAGDTGNPKSANIRAIMNQHQLQTSVYIGDTEGDYHAAKESGVPFIYAAYGFGQVDNPDYTIFDLSELTKLF